MQLQLQAPSDNVIPASGSVTQQMTVNNPSQAQLRYLRLCYLVIITSILGNCSVCHITRCLSFCRQKYDVCLSVCLSVCLCVPKDLTNCWIWSNMVLIHSGAFHRFINILGEGTTSLSRVTLEKNLLTSRASLEALKGLVAQITLSWPYF